MNAARILIVAGVDVDALSAHLGPVKAEEVNVWPAARWIRSLWSSGIRGVTLWRLVLADPDIMTGDKRRLARFVVHELTHVRQFAELGYLRFMTRYLKEYWAGRLKGQSHRDAYLAISFEVEARELARRYA